MGPGAIVGAVVGVVLGVVLLATLAFWVIRRRRRRDNFTGDLDSDIQDDTKSTAHVVHPGALDDGVMLDSGLPVLVDSKPERPRPTPAVRRQRQRIVHHEEDAGALPAAGMADDGVSPNFEPPVYREGGDEHPDSRELSTRAGRRPWGPRGPRTLTGDGPDITAEEIKYLGQPSRIPTSPPTTGTT